MRASKSRFRRAILPVSLLGIMFLYVHSCVAVPMTDLKLAEAIRVPASAFPEGDLQSAFERRGGMLWKLSLEGDAGWIAEVKRHDLNSYETVVRCGDRGVGLPAFGPYVGRVRVSTQGDAIDSLNPTTDRLRYDIYLPETGEYRSQDDFNAPMPSYDLSRERIRLCVTIAGGAMHGAYARSNEVEIELGEDR